MRLAYLFSRYPTVTHTFLLREICGLRDCGFEIRVISVHGSDRPMEQLSAQEREERDNTYVVLEAGLVSLGRAPIPEAIQRPRPASL